MKLFIKRSDLGNISIISTLLASLVAILSCIYLTSPLINSLRYQDSTLRMFSDIFSTPFLIIPIVYLSSIVFLTAFFWIARTYKSTSVMENQTAEVKSYKQIITFIICTIFVILLTFGCLIFSAAYILSGGI